MIPQPPDFLDLFWTEHRAREAAAAAERLRGPASFRTGVASALRGLADHLAPPSVPPRTVSLPVAVRRPQPASSQCRHAA
jgi:hypothetical protein